MLVAAAAQETPGKSRSATAMAGVLKHPVSSHSARFDEAAAAARRHSLWQVAGAAEALLRGSSR